MGLWFSRSVNKLQNKRRNSRRIHSAHLRQSGVLRMDAMIYHVDCVVLHMLFIARGINFQSVRRAQSRSYHHPDLDTTGKNFLSRPFDSISGEFFLFQSFLANYVITKTAFNIFIDRISVIMLINTVRSPPPLPTFATRTRAHIYLRACPCMINAGTCEAIFHGNR